jgi:hypothetical protein
MTKELKLQMQQEFIYVTNENNQKVRYDLKRKTMQRYSKRELEWVNVKQQYEFFSPYSLNHIKCVETERFLELLKITKEINPNCYSLSTFLARLGEALIYENYIRAGIDTQREVWRGSGHYYHRNLLSRPLEFYSKNTQKIFQKYKVKIMVKMEKTFIQDYDFMEKFISDIDLSVINDNDKKQIIEDLDEDDHLIQLVKDFKYDTKTLLKFIYGYLIPFENMDLRDAITTLRDYYSMASQIGREVKKYPKYLHSMHDIINSNFKAFKKNYDENKFEELIKFELEYETKQFSILVPKSPKEIIDEGVQLNHCVGSYVDRILRGECYIFFLRMTEEKEKSILTLEMKDNKITQCKGSYNRSPTVEELQFLNNYCQKKKLIMENKNAF